MTEKETQNPGVPTQVKKEPLNLTLHGERKTALVDLNGLKRILRSVKMESLTDYKKALLSSIENFYNEEDLMEYLTDQVAIHLITEGIAAANDKEG